MQVITNTYCIVLGNIHCVRQYWHGLVRGSVHSNIAIIGYKIHCIPQHNNYTSGTHCGPTAKTLPHLVHDLIIIHKKFKEFKAAFFELLRIEVFNKML